MRAILAHLTLGLVTAIASSTCQANLSEQDRRAEAQAMCETITATQKAYGKEKTLTKANNPNGDFQKQGLHVFAYDAATLTLAHPNPDLVGKNLLDLNHEAAMLLKKEISRIGDNKDGNGWLNFSWANGSKTPDQVTSYIERFDDVYWVCAFTQ
ncbi:MAG: hypothetical protein RL748_2908 [Pseudomonadota bacterium]|jgi:hypothetical protein